MSRLEQESSFPNSASTSQEGQEVSVTLLSSEWQPSKGGLSTIIRELAIQLAEQPGLKVSVYLPQCNEDDKRDARRHNVQLIEAEELPGFDPIESLIVAPANHVLDYVIGLGVTFGRYAHIFKQQHPYTCKWIQVVHTAPEELGKYETYADAISKGQKKHQAEVTLCERADQVVAVGPKLKEAYSRYLRYCQKDQTVVNLTPSIFSEFLRVKQSTEERETFYVLVLEQGNSEDFQLKGYDIVAKAIACLKFPFHLMFVGAPSGKEEEVSKQLVDLGIDRSQFTVRCSNENREQLAKLFCEVDLATMPSRTEGFGLVALEALSASLPVLVSGNSGFGEALKKVPYGSQWVVDSENPQDWANAIKTVQKKDRGLRLEEIKLLREEYAKKFSWNTQCKMLVARMRNITPGTAAQEWDSSVNSSCTSQGNLQANQGVASSRNLNEGSAEKLASKTSKRSLCHGSSPSPKKRRLTTPGYEDYKNEVKIRKDEYERRSLVKPLPCWNSIQLLLEVMYPKLEIAPRRKTDFRLENNDVDLLGIFGESEEDTTLTKMYILCLFYIYFILIIFVFFYYISGLF